MSVTLKDIARKVGYSVTTVSRALNDYDDVSEETKQLIKRVAQEMGDHPHVIAQSLQRRRTNTEEDLSNPFWAHITLAFRDIPPSMYDEVLDYLREAPLPTEPFCRRHIPFHGILQPRLGRRLGADAHLATAQVVASVGRVI